MMIKSEEIRLIQPGVSFLLIDVTRARSWVERGHTLPGGVGPRVPGPAKFRCVGDRVHTKVRTRPKFGAALQRQISHYTRSTPQIEQVRLTQSNSVFKLKSLGLDSWTKLPEGCVANLFNSACNYLSPRYEQQQHSVIKIHKVARIASWFFVPGLDR